MENTGCAGHGITVSTTRQGETCIVSLSGLPRNAADLGAFDLTDEYESAAAVFCVLAAFEEHFDDAFAMLDVLMGPVSPSGFDRSFIREQLRQYPYVMRSYFAGAAADNNYTPSEWKLAFAENPYSRANEGYVKLFCRSAGADTPRAVTLRQKASTKEWFLFSDSYKGLMAGIRTPAAEDPWK